MQTLPRGRHLLVTLYRHNVRRVTAPAVAEPSALSRASTSVRNMFRTPTHPSWKAVAEADKKHIVILGTGWGGYALAKHINRDLYKVSMVSPRNHFLFTPLLASTTTGTLEYRCITEPVRALPNLKYHQARCMDIDVEKKELTLRDSFNTSNFYDISYDYLVYAVGARPNDFGIPGVTDYAFFLKQVRDAQRIRAKIQELFERASKPTTSRAEKDRLLSIVVVGGGPTSVEFSGELYDWIMTDGAKLFPELVASCSITLLEAMPDILPGFGRDLAQYTISNFRARKIRVMTNAMVVGIDGDNVQLKDGYTIPYGIIVWATGIKPQPLTQKLELEKSRTGRVVVDEFLKCQDSIYCIGDAAETSSMGALPPTAQVAAQQGKYLAKTFNSFLTKPQPEFDETVRKYDTTFKFMYKGSMAYIGSWKGVVNLPHHNDPNASELKKRLTRIQGMRAWLFWHSAYFTLLNSTANRILVPMYWMKAWVFGRDFSRF